MEVAALHGDYDVQVDLEIVADAFFDGEGMRFMPAPPAREFREGEEEGDGYHRHGPFSAAGGFGYILGFCFGCWRKLGIGLIMNFICKQVIIVYKVSD